MSRAANIRLFMPRLLRLAGLLLLLALSACDTASTIVIKGNYPSPLARKIPLTLGVYYPPELRSYTYTEMDDSTGKAQYIVQSGAAQLHLFNTVLPSLFNKVVWLDSPELAVGNTTIDAVFIPSIGEFQMSLPQKTRLKVYEIWLKYNMKLTKTSGEQIADWVMTAYGKAPEESLQPVESGVQNAAMVAMRDLEASFTLGFATVPDVKEWLQANTGK
jgi:hypothetical protein